MTPGSDGPTRAVAPARIPLATYRLQFNCEFTFAHAADLVDYLRDLGISDAYASPLFQAEPHSTHGYDVCGYGQFSATLGGAAGFDRFSGRLRELNLGLLLDMVPNHMGAALTNEWWLDVLEQGPASPYAGWFDINWEPARSYLRHQVLLPTLEDHYAQVLEAGKLRLVFDQGRFGLRYHDRTFPVAAGSYLVILRQILECLSAADGNEDCLRETGECWRRITSRPAGMAAGDLAGIQSQLRARHAASAAFRQAVAAALAGFNGQPGNPRSFDRLDGLIRQQHYRLACWRVGSEEINYRRFFDVTELISLRMELPDVFQAAHELIFRLVREGRIAGLRIDHPDGLWDPRQYFARLQEQGCAALAAQASSAQSGALYLVAEKILAAEEPLPRDWPIHGTTGYDFLNQANGLFIDSAAHSEFDRVYRQFVGEETEFEDLVYASKQKILGDSLINELNALTHRVKTIATATRYGIDFTFSQLQTALAGLIAAFPVYRTYSTEETTAPAAIDREQILQARAGAQRRDPSLEPAVLDFVQRLLLLEIPEDLPKEQHRDCRTFVLRFQQLTAPVMAKGLEDTAFYNYNRLVSLNEVGGRPSRFGVSVAQFHEFNQRLAEHWPHTLLASATHDTKRGEDVRARLNVLSEMPEVWRESVRRWSRLNADKKTPIADQLAPHPNDEYLLYQTLVGAWPREAETQPGLEAFRERVSAYMLKAVKEAKSRTSWTQPNVAYEAATQRFVELLLASGPNPFLEDFQLLQRRVAWFGRFNSLAQCLLKLTSPGVPDFYQGAELWDLALVDPDNRRPVDYSLRRRLLCELGEKLPPGRADRGAYLQWLAQEEPVGQAKLFVIWRTLQFRRRQRELYDAGSYQPLSATGPRAGHLCAFARTAGGRLVITLVPRLVARLVGGSDHGPMGPEVWRDTGLTLPGISRGTRFRSVFTEELILAEGAKPELPVAQVLAWFPVALLEKAG